MANGQHLTVTRSAGDPLPEMIECACTLLQRGFSLFLGCVATGFRLIAWVCGGGALPDAASARGSGRHVPRNVGKRVVSAGSNSGIHGFAYGTVDVVPATIMTTRWQRGGEEGGGACSSSP